MGTSAENASVQVSTTENGTYTVLDEVLVNEFRVENTIAVADDHDSNDAKNLYDRRRFAVEVSGHYRQADVPTAAVRDASINQSSVWVKYLHDGTSGWKFEALVPLWRNGPPVEGLIGYAARFLSTGPATVI